MTQDEIEDFLVWREHPMTRRVMAHLTEQCEAARDAWISASWNTGEADQVLLASLRSKAAAYEYVTTFSPEDLA